MAMKPIKESERKYWDVAVFMVILIATFEIPYDLLVGHSNVTIQRAFNFTFYVIFGIDIILNLFTEQSVVDKESGDHTMTTTIKQGRIAYIKSIWFIIDILAIFPFDLLFAGFGGLNISRSLRFIRLPRLFRIFRAMRGVKGVHLVSKLAQAWNLNPSYARFVAITVLIPWVAHVLACFYYYYEGNGNLTFVDSINGIFVAFVENTAPSQTNIGGKITGYIAVLFGYIFFGAFIGNFASMFDRFDEQRGRLLDSYKKWDLLFKKYPKAFDAALKNKILNVTRKRINDQKLYEEDTLISELPGEIESMVRTRIGKDALNDKSE